MAKKMPTVAEVAEDLSISNDMGDGHYGYIHLSDRDVLLLERYSEDGKVEETFVGKITFEKEEV